MKQDGQWLASAASRNLELFQDTDPSRRRSGAPTRWDEIYEAWRRELPAILGGETVSPYFFDWCMTPIEERVWRSIRARELPFYPQCPVDGVFLSFGDPLKRLGLELDGKSVDRDEEIARDRALLSVGWRVFRITAAQTQDNLPSPDEAGFAGGAARDSEEYLGDLTDWATETTAGTVWSVGVLYYGLDSTQEERAVARWSLALHQRIAFDLPGASEDSTI